MNTTLLYLLLLLLGDGGVVSDPVPDPPACGGYRLRRYSRST